MQEILVLLSGGWGVFAALIVGLMVLDLGVLNRKAHAPSFKESLWTTLFYVMMAAGFGVWVWMTRGAVSGKEFFTGYLVEQSLSLDNIFVISMIFGYLNIPAKYQHRALFWGILGAIIFRGLLIAAGAVLVAKFEWVLYIFAVFLLWTGIKMLTAKAHGSVDLEQNWLLKYLRGHFKITPQLEGERFFVKKVDSKGKTTTWITPLFVALMLIEFADIIFAFDSVPAIFAITKDPFIVYTSNIFAILGLRSLYFTLSAMISKFEYLKVSLSLVLVFIGCKVLAAPLLGLHKIPAEISLGGTVLILGGGIVASLIKMSAKKRA